MQSLAEKVKSIPDTYATVTPYLIVDGVSKLIDFLKRTFDAEERGRISTEDGRVGHAEIKIGGSMVMMADSNPRYSPIASHLWVYVENVDAVYKRAIEAGGVSHQEPTTQIWGDRTAAVEDPTSNTWWIATHVEKVSQEEMKARMEKEALTGDPLTPDA